MLRRAFHIVMDAIFTFAADDGWAIASHIALSALMSMFPFLIFVTALAAVLDLRPLAGETIAIILDTWPDMVAQPIAREIYNVVNHVRADLMTFGVGFAIYFSSNGVESLRIGLNRAYQMREARPWYRLRFESMLYVLVGALGMLALSFLVVLGPLLWRIVETNLPAVRHLSPAVALARYAATSIILVIGLVVAHKWLPAGHRTLREIAPGIGLTLLMWLVAGAAFGFYLSEFPANYVTTYAGLASVMIALVFLYLTSAIFLFGGELNAAMARARAARAAQGLTPARLDISA